MATVKKNVVKKGTEYLRRTCRQTFAVALPNFCRDVDKLLPWSFQSFQCRGAPNFFVTLTKSYFRLFKNKSPRLKLK